LSPLLRVLSAGAAQAVVSALARAEGFALQAEFGAVGAIRKKFLEGEPCDLIVLTRPLIDELRAAGRVVSTADLGTVSTGIAVREADPLPSISSSAELKSALQQADEIYFPDPQKATAGIHFAKVLGVMRLDKGWKTFPNGASAMREMARSRASRVIGCTQATEILNTPGARLVGPLPAEFQLSTLYSAGVCQGASNAQAAQRFLAQLAGDGSRQLRLKAGFNL
jgi:molybdate transport system substrate-binding protein